MLLALVAYFGIGYYIYDLFTTVHPRCGSVYMDGRREFTPSSFKGVYYPENNTDVQPYLVKNFETVEFPARGDGNTISGWFIPSTTPSDRVVIVVHGADVCRKNTTVLLSSGMLANNGFNVLSIDLRNHGDLNGTNMDMDVISPIRSIQKLHGRPVAIVHESTEPVVPKTENYLKIAS